MAPDVQRRETGFVLCSHVERVSRWESSSALEEIFQQGYNTRAGETRNVTLSEQQQLWIYSRLSAFRCLREDGIIARCK